MATRGIPSALVALALVACEPGASFDGKLGARFRDRSALPGLSVIEGLYFGELEIVAYDHRPGQSLQASGGFGNGNPSDWSYWVALQSGHDAARDNVLALGQQIDFDAMNGDFARPIEQEFVDGVGRFEVDFLEVYLHRTGILYNGAYFGMNADLNGLSMHPLHKHPQWSSYDDQYCTPEFPGFPAGGQDLNVFFARSDWFPQAMRVRVSIDGTSPPVIEASSPALTSSQTAQLLSLLEQGTRRRFYRDLLVIPYAGPVVLDLTNGQTPPATDGGQPGTPAPSLTSAGNVVNAANVAVSVNFDLSDTLDAATDLQVPRVVYKADSNGVPFGLDVSFEPVP
jgi:hypothetical protein